MIAVQDLTKNYYLGKVIVNALRGISFTVKQGEFVAIMGKSGSGKSTLLRQMGLLDRPTSGQIKIGGDDILALTSRQRTAYRLNKLGYVFQEYALMPELTAIENVYLPAMMMGLSVGEYTSQAELLLERVDLTNRLHHRPKELSGGEQQRVAIARALVNQPEILFADEPCANLDSTSAERIFCIFKELNQNLGQTIVLVTHDEDDLQWVNRVIRLADGRIVHE